MLVRPYTHRLLYSAAVVLILSCLVMVGNSWEAALHAPWVFPILLFERSEAMAFIMHPLAAAGCTVAVLLLAACRTAATVAVTAYFSLSIIVTIDLLARYDGHS